MTQAKQIVALSISLTHRLMKILINFDIYTFTHCQLITDIFWCFSVTWLATETSTCLSVS